MCGIAGILGPGARNQEPLVHTMTDRIAHRGPDGDGFAAYDHCVLGHRRLAIVDLSPGGKQPMLSPDGTVAITFNGEIYGYKELKAQFSTYNFKTSSDTEVILALYDKYGENFVEHLPGMFALALWDNKTQTFIAARDRFGEKPFYYAQTDKGELIFGSEIKALLASGLVTPVLNPDALARYMHRLFVGPVQSIYSNIHPLAPGHTLIWKDGSVTTTPYWHLPDIKETISLDEATLEFRRLFEDAVRKQLVADVPVGAFLSGGLDSSSVVSVASRFSPHIKTFAFGFNSTKNELSYARMAAEQYRTDHYELHDTDQNIPELLFAMNEIHDEPFADSSNIPTYLISQKAREYTKVALSGDAGDELLGGYGSYRRLLPDYKEPADMGRLAFLRKFIKRPAFAGRDVHFTEAEIKSLGLIGSAHPDNFIKELTPDDALRHDQEDRLPGNILARADRASMAHGLELRAPFLDQPFAEFAASLPYRLKLSNEADKIILRRAYEEAWPEPIRKRSKQGFGAPVGAWLKKPEVAALVHEYLDDHAKSIFKHISFDQARIYAAKGDYKTWILLVLSIWMEKNLK